MTRGGLLFILTATVLAAAAQVLPPELAASGRRVMQQIYSLDHIAAESTCRSMIVEHREDPLGYVLLARTLWAAQLTVGQGLSVDRFAGAAFYTGAPEQRIPISPEAEQAFRQALDAGVSSARDLLARNPSDLGARFALGLAYQTLAAYEFSMKASWWSAFKAGESALSQHRPLAAAAPDFVDARLMQATSDYLVGSLPKTIRWLPYLMGYRGDKTKGKLELQDVASRGVLLADDARTVLILLNAREKQYDHALHELEILGQKYPRNYLAPLESAALALRAGQPQRAIAIYLSTLTKVEQQLQGFERLDPSVVHLRLGVATRSRGDLKGSAQWLDRVLKNAEASARVRAMAHLELGKTSDLAGNRQMATDQYALVLNVPDFMGSQREARSLLAKPYDGQQ